jgi:hypothetical protein
VYQITPTSSRRAERAAPERGKEEEIEPPVLEQAETISLEDAEVAEAPAEDEGIVDLGDDEAAIPAAEDETVFLEEQSDEEPDVTGIVGEKDSEEG